MRGFRNTWAIVLATDHGSTLRDRTPAYSGETVPDSSRSLHGERYPVQDAIRRANAVAAPQLTGCVVAEEDRQRWSTALKAVPHENIFVQPCKRGSAHEVLLALLQLKGRDPNSVVLLLPAVHQVVDERTMVRYLQTAVTSAANNPTLVYLLGVDPLRPDQELGYIVPSARRRSAAKSVLRFVEKPSAENACELIKQGALWNTFIFAGSVRALLSLFETHFGSTVTAMTQALEFSKNPLIGNVALELLYADLISADFARHVLEVHEQDLQVLRVPTCGWTHLGAPHRVGEAADGPSPVAAPVAARQSLTKQRPHSSSLQNIQSCSPRAAGDRCENESPGFDVLHSEENILSWRAYLPPECIQSMIHMGWDVST